MSIQDEINAHLASGKLFHLRHTIKGVANERTIIVNNDVLGAVDLRNWTGNERYRLAQLRAELDRFIGGDRVAVMMAHKKKAATSYLKRLDPTRNEVWEIRSCDPKPGSRVLGRFVEQDCFVCLYWDFRETIKWDDACTRCLDQWMDMFPSCAAFSGRSSNDYVSRSFSV